MMLGAAEKRSGVCSGRKCRAQVPGRTATHSKKECRHTNTERG